MELLHNMENKTDGEIIALYKDGNQGAFKELINRYTSILYNFTARLTGPANAPDLVQEIFIKVWKNINNFDETKASFKTWVFTIARNTTTDFLRKKKSVLFSDMAMEGEDGDMEDVSESIPDESLLPDKLLEKLQDKEVLNKTLLKIKPSYREILSLHYEEDLTFDEIGKVLGQPLNTVKSKHRRAILELRKLLEE